MKKNPRSEAAIKRVIKNWDDIRVTTSESGFAKLIQFWKMDDNEGSFEGDELIAELDLREFIKKRQPLKGIKKQVDKIVRGSKTKQKGIKK